MKALLLAAGAGSRLKPLTDTIPKPLAPIANIPLLERTVSWLAEEGVDEVVINLHHHADQIVDVIGDGRRLGVTITYSREEQLLGTSGALRRCVARFQDEPFFVIYGDNLIDADLNKLYKFHVASDSSATIALFVPDDPSASGMVDVEQNGQVRRFVEKPKPGESTATMANAGIYVIAPDLLSTLPDGFSDFGNDMFPQWLDAGHRIFATPLGGYLQDTGTFDRYRKANWDVLSGMLRYKPLGETSGQSLVATNAVVHSTAKLIGPNIVAESCQIGAGASLADCILWRGAKVGAHCNLANVIMGAGAVVGEGTNLADCAVV